MDVRDMRTGRVNARQFTRRFMLQKPGGTKDNFGHVDLSVDANWDDIGEYWLKLHSQSSREFFRAQQVQSDVTHVADVAYSKVTAELDTAWRWFDGQRRLNISDSFDPEDNNEVIQMRLVEAT